MCPERIGSNVPANIAIALGSFSPRLLNFASPATPHDYCESPPSRFSPHSLLNLLSLLPEFSPAHPQSRALAAEFLLRSPTKPQKTETPARPQIFAALPAARASWSHPASSPPQKSASAPAMR